MAKRTKKSKSPPKRIGVKTVPTNSLLPNPHNPRLLFDKLPLDALRDSIERNGILVPLTVYYDSRRERYVILDGQRRWTCAEQLGIAKVPVNEVAEPSLIENIVTMFQIHKLREDWELMPTALKLEVLMNETDDRNNKRLSVMTGLDEAVVVRCKKLLSYPAKYQDMMLDPDPRKRKKADFFIELYPIVHDRAVRKFTWFKQDTFTRQMLAKAEAGGLRSVTDFRKVKEHITNAVRAKRVRAISAKLRTFAENPTSTPDELAIASAEIQSHAKKLLRSITKLKDDLDEIDAAEYYGEQELWDALEELMHLAESKLEDADRRLK